MEIQGEVIVADNGSTDGSQEIAIRAVARFISINEKGYGSALQGGISAALGNVMSEKARTVRTST
jgi:glycosyltransferase involved in cell wall biosynthesis